MQINSHFSANPLPPLQEAQSSRSVPGRDREEELANNTRFQALDEAEKNTHSQGDKRSSEQTTEKKEGAASKEENPVEQRKEQELQEKLDEEREQVTDLAARDREVRAHEQAHMAVGGQYAGAASYQYTRGPDGVNYAVSGEVPISTSKESTPEATIQKAQVVRRAALAPAEPSPQDRQVAAQATALEAEARKELGELAREESVQAEESKKTERAEQEALSERSGENASRTLDQVRNVQQDSNNTITSLPTFAPGSTGGKLIQSVANASLSSNDPGAILDQLA